MNKETNFRQETPQDPDDKMEEEFKDFIDENKFTSDQMEKAYYTFCGISEEGEQDEVIKKIVSKMTKMADRRFPINRFAELIEAKGDYENAETDYFEYINNLDISEKEKRVLHSIVERKRAGELELIVGGKTAVEFKLEVKDVPTEGIALGLKMAIEEAIEAIPAGKKYNFTFAEE